MAEYWRTRVQLPPPPPKTKKGRPVGWPFLVLAAVTAESAPAWRGWPKRRSAISDKGRPKRGLACLTTSATAIAPTCGAIRVIRSVAILPTISSIRVVCRIAILSAISPIRVVCCIAVLSAISPRRVVCRVAILSAISPIRVIRSAAVSTARHAWRGNVPIRLSGRRTCSYQCNTAYQCLNLIHRKFLKLVVPSLAVRSSVTPTVSFTGVRKD